MISVLSLANNLNKSDNSETLILEYIDHNISSDDTLCYPLTEAIGLCPELLSYSILIESVDAIKNVEKELKDTEKTKDPEKKIKMIDKLIQSVKNLFNWWYKVDPNKKYKTLHIILKILIKVIAFLILLYYPERSLITKKVAARIPLPIGYEGNNKLLTLLFSKKTLAAMTVRSIISQIFKVIKNTDSKIEMSVNIKDIEKAIEEYDKAIDEINDLLENTGDPQIKMTLEKSKKDLEDTLKYLIKLKEKRDAESSKNDRD